MIASALRVHAIGAGLVARLGPKTRLPGRRHSVFARAVNFQTADGALLTVQGPGLLAAPFAIALTTWSPETAGEHLGFDLDGACLVDLAIRPALDRETAREVLASALATAPRGAIAAGLESKRGRAARTALSRAVPWRDADAFLDATRGLVGLGEGLTPAGDDYLVGALAILHRLAGGWPVCAPSPARALAEQAQAGTTTVGAAFLAHAVAGEFSEPLRDLVMASSADAARAAAGVLARMGATSGADTLAGMRATLDALADGRP